MDLSRTRFHIIFLIVSLSLIASRDLVKRSISRVIESAPVSRFNSGPIDTQIFRVSDHLHDSNRKLVEGGEDTPFTREITDMHLIKGQVIPPCECLFAYIKSNILNLTFQTR